MPLSGAEPGKLILMRTPIPLERQPAQNRNPRRSLSPCVQAPFWVLAASAFFLSAPWLLGAQTPAAQAPSTPPASIPAHKATQPHRRPSTAHPLPPPPQPAPVKPAAPEPPHWPANDKPANASVTWDSHGLRIAAENSSLQQILRDVSAETGTKIEGLAADQRVFGAYGPGQARDVISQLLEGSGYNVMMIGDQGQGTPRQIVLTSRGGANPQPAANPNPAATGDEDSDVDEQPQPQPGIPPPFRPGFAPGAPPRNMREMTPENQQMPQHQQPAQPPNNPQN